MSTLHPYVLVGPKGLQYLGLHASEADCWMIALGWPDEEEIQQAKDQGYRVHRAQVFWTESPVLQKGYTPSDTPT